MDIIHQTVNGPHPLNKGTAASTRALSHIKFISMSGEKILSCKIHASKEEALSNVAVIPSAMGRLLLFFREAW